MKKFLLIFFCLIAPVYGQSSKIQLTNEINTNLPTNGANGISAATLRTTLIDMVNSWNDLNGSSSSTCPTNQVLIGWTTLSTPLCSSTVVNSFNSRTGAVTPQSGDYSFSLLGGSLALSQIANATGAGVIGALIAGTYSELTPAQVTTLCQVATTSLTGCGPIRDGVATDYLGGDGAYHTIASASPVTSVSNLDSTLGISPTTGAVVASVNRAANFGWSGLHSFANKVTFGSSTPWIDVRQASNGCAAASGNGTTDDGPAIQCQINYIQAHFGGGRLHFDGPANYLINTAITVYQGIWLEGDSAQDTALLTTVGITPVNFAISPTNPTSCPSGGHYGGMERLQVQGQNSAGSTAAAVIIWDNCNVVIRDSILWFGKYGLQTHGVDSYIENSFIWGYTAALESKGANWYIRDKFDQVGGTAAPYGYIQDAPIAGLSPAENHFILCDFTSYTTNSVLIQDLGANSAVTVFEGGVFASPIAITNAKVTIFNGAEIGSTTFSSAVPLIISGSYAFTPTTVTGAGTRSCGANINVTC